MEQDKQHKYNQLMFFFFFGLLFVYFMKPLSPVTDFWWHVSTGRWIIEHAAIPATDPFLFTSPPTLDYRGETIVQGYWLAQILYYGLVSLPFGWWIIVLFEALSFLFIYFILYKFLEKKISIYMSFAIISLVVFVTNNFIEVRPQVFTFLFLAIILYLFNKLEELPYEKDFLKTKIVFIPVVMLLWANMHPGVIVGFGVIVIYIFYYIFDLCVNKNYNEKHNNIIIFLCFSALCYFLNPINIKPFVLFLKDINFGSADISNTINEYLPPLEYYKIYSYEYAFYALIFISIISLFLLIKAWRGTGKFHKTIFFIFLIMAFCSFRYVFLFMIVCLFVSGHCLGKTNFAENKYANILSILIIISMSTFLLTKIESRKIFKNGPMNDVLISKAAEYISINKLNNNLFNSYEYGGYLIWKLYPEYKFFVDARTLSSETHKDYREAASGKKSSIFNKYNINSAVVSAKVQVSNVDRIPPLNYSLLKDDMWDLVYSNDDVVVFQKNNNRSIAGKNIKDRYIDELIRKYESLSISRPLLDYFLTLGELWYVKGDIPKAKYFFTEANRVAPGDELAIKWLAYLK